VKTKTDVQIDAVPLIVGPKEFGGRFDTMLPHAARLGIVLDGNLRVSHRTASSMCKFFDGRWRPKIR